MRLLALLLTLFLALPAQAAKVALVIGNGNYTHAGVLPNATNDATDVANRLIQMGFTVYGGLDMDRTQTLRALDDFSGALGPDTLALFYYAGHGVQLGAENYLIPIDTRAADEVSLAAASVKLQTVLRTMELRADRRIVILDACRNNPFVAPAAGRSIGTPSRGLARVEAGVGSYIAFSTQPGNIALDGNGRNSPFTDALLRHMGTPGEDLHELMRKVRADVVNATGQTQVPWENSSLVDRVYLTGTAAAPSPQPPVIAAPQPQPQPQPQLQPQAQPQASYHYVGGLDPQGDGFLALRAGTTADAPRLDKMTEGTLLTVLGEQGVWRRVRLIDGREGWAHSNWIRCCTTGTPAVATRTEPPASCEALWYERNAIWASHGYCFTSPRGIQAFGTRGCFRDQAQARAAMSPADRATVDRLLAREQAQGCR